jgi:hypothetical protein
VAPSSPGGSDSTPLRAGSRGTPLREVATLAESGLSDGSIDSLILLCGRPAAGHLGEELAAAARRLRSDGRLLIEYRSLAHRRACPSQLFAAEPGEPPAITIEDLAEAAAAADLCLVAAVPYGAFLPDGGHSRFLGALPTAGYWRRLLSWLPEDPSLLELALLIEQDLVAALPLWITDSFVAVLEKRRDPDGKLCCLPRHQALDALRQQTPIDLRQLEPALRRPLAALREHIGSLLAASLRCRRLFEALAAPILDGGHLTWADLVEPEWVAYFARVAHYRELDRRSIEWSRQAGTATPELASLLCFSGVSVGEALEYSLVEPLLTQGFGRFTGVRT